MRYPFLISGLCLALLSGCGTPDSTAVESPVEVAKPQTDPAEELRSALVSYMVQPRFAPQDMVEQVCGRRGKAYLDRHSERLYLVFSKEKFDTVSISRQLSHHPDSISWGNHLFAGIPGHQPRAKNEVVLAMPWQHFREDQFKGIEVRLPHHTYSLTPKELVNYATHRSVYGGRVDIVTAEAADAPRHLITNHGILVARKGEPSMQRMVAQFKLEGLTVEEKAQRILDFVTGELSYLDADAEGSLEMLKKPHEVLFTHGSDCSGLTVLYASLLEQTDVPYQLLYCKEHIAVGVKGDFPNENGTRFKLSDGEYTLAETTVPGYEIGKTKVLPPITYTSLRYFQRPGDSSKIFDFMTREPLKEGIVVMKPR